MNPTTQTVPRARRVPARLLGVFMIMAAAAASADSLVQQTFNLRAGWNAIWLEVEPTNAAPAVVFGGLPVESAWTYRQRLPAIDFIQNTSEPLWNLDQWLVWSPGSRPESIANNLFAVPGHRAYLLKLTGNATLTVTGTPGLRPDPWKPDAFNLRGFPVDPGSPPTFAEFFRPSPAHFDGATSQLQPIYELTPSGTWERVSPTALMVSGAAYWVYCKGGSDYMAPLSVQISPPAEGLEFGRRVPQFEITLRSHRLSEVDATLGEAPAPATPLIAYETFSPTNGTEWMDVPALLPQTLGPGESRRLRLAPRRQRLNAQVHDSVLEIRDNAGTRYLLPVHIARTATVANETHAHAGLWMGVAMVQRVSESHSGTLNVVRSASDGTPLEVQRENVSPTPTPVRSAFPLRLLIHVDDSGTARLLKEVTQMWRDGTYRTNENGYLEVDTPGRYVLITDPERLPDFAGVSIRNGELVGRRYSSIGFDFPGSGPQNTNLFVQFDGEFAPDETLTATINISENFNTNPYRHKYHPDHDNLDARYAEFRAEAFAISRAITLEIAAEEPTGAAAAEADYGYQHLAGTYRETVSGLHREPIRAEGLFRLKRISEIAELNPSTLP